MTVLARFDGQDTTGGAVWYEKAMEWARENGISDGSDPDGSITREQLATMLWRYAGSPAGGSSLSSFGDSASVSAYALEAVRWAVGEGLISGTDAGLLARHVTEQAVPVMPRLRQGKQLGQQEAPAPVRRKNLQVKAVFQTKAV